MKTRGLQADTEEYWKSKGWDLAILRRFQMSNVEPDPDALNVPGGLAVDDQPPPPPPPPNGAVPPPPAGRTFTEEELNAERERVRKEEKDKLYKTIEDMKKDLAEVTNARKTELEAQQTAAQKAEEEARKKAEEEMSAKELLEKKDQEWRQQFSALEAERDRDRAMLEMERRFAAVESYKTRRLGEAADEIMPELRDLVGGTSEEEVDQSIANAIAKTNAILANVQQHQQQQRQQQRGTSITTPPNGPLENDAIYETVTADDIRNMDMATYAKNRNKLLEAAAEQRRQQ